MMEHPEYRDDQRIDHMVTAGSVKIDARRSIAGKHFGILVRQFQRKHNL